MAWSCVSTFGDIKRLKKHNHTHTLMHTDKRTSFPAPFHLMSSNPSKRFSLLLRRWRKISSSLATPTLLFAALADFFGMAKQQRRAADKKRFEGEGKVLFTTFTTLFYNSKVVYNCFSTFWILISVPIVPYCMN